MTKKIDDGLTNGQRWYRNNNGRERSKIHVAKFRKEHPEREREQQKKYYEQHINERRERARRYYQDVRKAYMKTDEGRAKERMRKARRRAITSGLPATLTWAEWLEICERFHHGCAYCGKQCAVEQDHVIPVTKGGPHTKENVVPACKSCNSRKGNRLVMKPIS